MNSLCRCRLGRWNCVLQLHPEAFHCQGDKFNTVLHLKNVCWRVFARLHVSDFSLRVLICRFDSTSAHFPALPEASPADFLPSDTPEYNRFISWHDFILLLSPHYGILSSQADYFSCVATLLYSRKDTCLYRACPSLNCSKKVLDQHNGWFRCEKCNREFPDFKYRLLLSVSPRNVECLVFPLMSGFEKYIKCTGSHRLHHTHD